MPHYGHHHSAAALPLVGAVARQTEAKARKVKAKIRRKPAIDAMVEHDRRRDLMR